MTYGFRAPADRRRLPDYISALSGRYDFAELWAPSPHLAEDARLCQAAGLFVTTHARFHDLTLGAADAEIRDLSVAQLRRDLAASAAAGARLMVVHAGQLPWTDYPDPALSAEHADLRREEAEMRRAFLARAVGSVAELAKAARAEGIRLALENLPQPNEAPRTPEEMALFLPTGTDFCLDAGHAQMAGFSPADFLGPLGARVAHLHLHRNDGIYDLHLPPRDPAPAGFEGTALIELIRGGPEDYLALDFVRRSDAATPNQEMTL
jgi:sugar phosphate isomerase/epimerase